MRIVIFSDTFPPEINGVATSSKSLQDVLTAHGHLCVVVTTNPFTRTLMYDNRVIRIPGIELKKLYGYRMAGLYNSKAMKIIKAIKPDLVHVQTEAGIGIFGNYVARTLDLPNVYTYHTMYEDYTYYVTRGHLDVFAKKIVREFSRFKAEGATEFISPSQKTKDILRTYGVERYINIVPTGIDFSRFKDDRIDKEKLARFKHQYNLDNCFTILSLGRVAKEKSIDVIIDNFAKYISLNPEAKVKLLIVGGGPALTNLKNQAIKLNLGDKVVFIGPVPPADVPFYYHAADLFVSASVTETQGLTFMEAMASGLLLLARHDENLSDVLVDGETGYFFNEEKSFINNLNLLINLSTPRKKQMLTNSAQLIEKYSIDRFYLNIMEVYNRAIRRHF